MNKATIFMNAGWVGLGCLAILTMFPFLRDAMPTISATFAFAIVAAAYNTALVLTRLRGG